METKVQRAQSGLKGKGRGVKAGKGEVPYFVRELSWLEFNARVLAEAQNPLHPLLERLKFLAIFSANLDEFFMIHIPGMRERGDEETGRPFTPEGLRARLRQIQKRIKPLLEEQARTYEKVTSLLAEKGVRLFRHDELSAEQQEKLRLYFEREVFPVLTPLAVGPGHPFPYISNLSLSLAVSVFNPVTRREHFARVKIPTRPVLPRFVPLDSGESHFVLLEEIVIAHLGRLFSGMEIRASYPFRITRNFDLELTEDAADDLMEMIEQKLALRRFGAVERVEFAPSMPPSFRRMILDEIDDAEDEEVYDVAGPLHLSDFFALTRLPLPELRDAPFTPGIPAALRDCSDIFAAIREGDILLHHPYQSFKCVTDFIDAAAADPDTLTIKHTLYRTSGDSPILPALIEAAENGKQVACLVELKARFDEANNITWAKQLEKSGVHVVYGLLGLKTHCKVTLVVRREADGLRRYLHIGTGNYNPQTASVYTDIGILTCDPDFGADATDLFNYLTGYSAQDEFRQFLVAPVTLRNRLEAMIERETALSTPEQPGRIIAKMNALVDTSLIQALYRASQKGVQIDLIVRGMCCLRPGVSGLSENIRVMSVVGRFLEHSRIFYFGNGGDEEIVAGSADWMTRNLDRRVEVVIPIRSAEVRRVLKEEVLDVILQDNCQAWDLQPDGSYVRRKPKEGEKPYNSQLRLLAALSA